MQRIPLTRLSENYINTKTANIGREDIGSGKLLYSSQFLDVWNISYINVLQNKILLNRGKNISNAELIGVESLSNTIDLIFSIFNANRRKMKVTPNGILDPIPIMVLNSGLKEGHTMDLISLIEEQGLKKNRKIVVMIKGQINSNSQQPYAWGLTIADYDEFHDKIGMLSLPSFYITGNFTGDIELYEIILYRLLEEPVTNESNSPIKYAIANEFGDVYFKVNDYFKEFRKDDFDAVELFMKTIPSERNFTELYNKLNSTIFSLFAEEMYKKVFR
jgi:hypothetical protein